MTDERGMATLGLSKVFILDKYFTELQKFWETEKKLQGEGQDFKFEKQLNVTRLHLMKTFNGYVDLFILRFPLSFLTEKYLSKYLSTQRSHILYTIDIVENNKQSILLEILGLTLNH